MGDVTQAEADNVTVHEGWVLTLDGCTTAIANRVDVYGTLRFEDGSDSTLRARYIHVAAGTRNAM